MTKYEVIQKVIYQLKDEEKKYINQPGNIWADHCYRQRKGLEEKLENLTLSEACKEI